MNSDQLSSQEPVTGEPPTKKKKHREPILQVRLVKYFQDALFDFFLLFIAVSLGFVSNNLRETYLGRLAEKGYITSMVYDVEEDTASLSAILTETRTQLMGVDTLLQLFEKREKEFPVDELYRLFFKYFGTYTDFTSRDLTISQMKGAGDLHLLRSKAISDSIVTYYSLIESYKEQGNYNRTFFQGIIKMELELFDFSVFRLPDRKKAILHPEKLDEFYNHVLIMGSIIQNDRIWMKGVKANGARLSAYLRDKYGVQKK